MSCNVKDKYRECEERDDYDCDRCVENYESSEIDRLKGLQFTDETKEMKRWERNQLI